MGRLTARHLATHGLTTAQYREAYEGGLRTCSSCGCSKPASTEFFYQNGPRLSSICRECAKHQAVMDERARDAKKTAERQKLADQPGAVVQCRICSIWYDQITATHLSGHGTDLARYRTDFPDAPLQSDAVKDRAVEAHGFDEEFRAKRSQTMKDFWAESTAPEVIARRHALDEQAKLAVLKSREGLGIATYRTTEVPESLHGAIVGMVLGDSGLDGRKPTRHAHLALGHCESQLPYLQWKVELLGSLVTSPVAGPYLSTKRQAEPFYNARTIAHPYFSELHDQVYGDRGKRFVTPDVVAPLDPQGLAIWYQDDGDLKATGDVRIATCSFTEPSIDYLITVLAQKFGIDSTRQQQGNGFIIYIRRSSLARFFSLVAPHVHPCMRYKLPERAI